MSRVQLALNVADLDAAIAFYSKLFATEPAKVRSGYANFAIEDPPLKLVLIEGAGAPGSLNHLGVEVPDAATVVAATRRLHGDGLAVEVEDGVECCYALQDKVWVHGADGEPWEVYTVLADAEVIGCGPARDADGSGISNGPLQQEEVPVTTARGNCCG
ncbi:MAG: ArsI/CadI family heavy metal resistance metalloenzyme [Acidimicrobiales bacterium]